MDGNFCPLLNLLFSFPKAGSASPVFIALKAERPLDAFCPFQLSHLLCSPHPCREISERCLSSAPLLCGSPSRHHAERAICWPFLTKLSLMLPGFSQNTLNKDSGEDIWKCLMAKREHSCRVCDTDVTPYCRLL